MIFQIYFPLSRFHNSIGIIIYHKMCTIYSQNKNVYTFLLKHEKQFSYNNFYLMIKSLVLKQWYLRQMVYYSVSFVGNAMEGSFPKVLYKESDSVSFTLSTKKGISPVNISSFSFLNNRSLHYYLYS